MSVPVPKPTPANLLATARVQLRSVDTDTDQLPACAGEHRADPPPGAGRKAAENLLNYRR